jgi:hypothetical protein
MLHWTTTARQTEEKMGGDRDRPLGLTLGWMMMMMVVVVMMMM